MVLDQLRSFVEFSNKELIYPLSKMVAPNFPPPFNIYVEHKESNLHFPVHLHNHSSIQAPLSPCNMATLDSFGRSFTHHLNCLSIPLLISQLPTIVLWGALALPKHCPIICDICTDILLRSTATLSNTGLLQIALLDMFWYISSSSAKRRVLPYRPLSPVYLHQIGKSMSLSPTNMSVKRTVVNKES